MIDITFLLLLLTRGLFILLGLLTWLDFLRHRGRVRLDIALMFGILALISLIGQVGEIISLPSWLNQLTSLLLMSHPYLLLRLVQHFRLPSQTIQGAAIAGMIISWLVLLIIPGQLPLPLSFALVAYFVGYESYAAWFFAGGAVTSRGVTRRRLILAAYGSIFLALTIFLIALIPILPNQEELLTGLFFLLAILSALSYYLGFTPPHWLRLAWQQAELQHFLHQMTEQPVNVRASMSGKLLCEAAARAVGAVAAIATRWDEENQQLNFWASRQPSWAKQPVEILHQEVIESLAEVGLLAEAWQQEEALITKPNEQTAKLASRLGAKALMLVPIRTTERVWGLLFVLLPAPPFFAHDDLAQLTLMAEQTAFTLDYEASLEEQRTLVERLRFLQSVTQAMNQAVDFNSALAVVLKSVCQITGWNYGAARIPSPTGEFLISTPAWYSKESETGIIQKELSSFRARNQAVAFAPNVGLAGRVWVAKRPEWIENLEQVANQSGTFYRSDMLLEQCFKAALAVPIIINDEVLAVLIFFMSESRQEDRRLVELVKTAATQLGSVLRRKQAEEALQLAHEELERRVEARTAKLKAANAELEEFAYVVSHDLRAPLRAMKSYAQFLAEDFEEELDDFGMEYVSGIAESADLMDNLVVDLLEYSRIGRSRVKYQKVELSHLLRQLVRHLGFSGVEIQLPADAPTVQGSSVLLMQIFANLLSNGVKFCRQDVKPVLTVSWSDEADAWHFSVRDNGIGIQKKYLEKIFGIFQRLHTQDEYEGTGVGLAIVKKAVLEHGGQIWVKSEVGQGTTFTFSLPKKRTVQSPVTDEKES